MKSFFEEYGFVILAAIVVILLIAMCTPIGNLVKSQITGIVDSFANKTNSKLDAVDVSENSAFLAYNGNGLNLTYGSGNSTDEFEYIVHYTSGSKKYSTKVANCDGGPANETAKAGTMDIVTTALNDGGTKNDMKADVGTQIQVEVHNKGTGEVFYSNSVTVLAATE